MQIKEKEKKLKTWPAHSFIIYNDEALAGTTGMEYMNMFSQFPAWLSITYKTWHKLLWRKFKVKFYWCNKILLYMYIIYCPYSYKTTFMHRDILTHYHVVYPI